MVIPSALVPSPLVSVAMGVAMGKGAPADRVGYAGAAVLARFEQGVAVGSVLGAMMDAAVCRGMSFPLG